MFLVVIDYLHGLFTRPSGINLLLGRFRVRKFFQPGAIVLFVELLACVVESGYLEFLKCLFEPDLLFIGCPFVASHSDN